MRWQPCFRVISSRFPPIHLFERVSNEEDWEALYWLESLTNPRLREVLAGTSEREWRLAEAVAARGSCSGELTGLAPAGQQPTEGKNGRPPRVQPAGECGVGQAPLRDRT